MSLRQKRGMEWMLFRTVGQRHAEPNEVVEVSDPFRGSWIGPGADAFDFLSSFGHVPSYTPDEESEACLAYADVPALLRFAMQASHSIKMLSIRLPHEASHSIALVDAIGTSAAWTRIGPSCCDLNDFRDAYLR